MAYKVTLNGANYVSEERQRAFEQALEEPNGNELGDEPASNSRPVQAQTGTPEARASGPTAAPKKVSQRPRTADTTDRPTGPTRQSPAVDPTRVLAGLERGLEQSYDHQSETLRVHQHYLNNEAAYASIFAQLMQEQGSLFANGLASGDASRERAEVVLQVLDSLSKSIERFHEHQAETRDVHSRFLSQQAEFTQAYMGLLRSHYGVALSSGTRANGHGNDHDSENNAESAGGNGNGWYVQDAYTMSRVADVDVQSEGEDTAPSRDAAYPASVSGSVPETEPSTELQRSAPGSREGGDLPVMEELSTVLLDIVSDKTGYPAEMLELDMDMEADLGIDSIKRVEILGALQDAYPDLPEVETDALAELRTLEQVLAYVQNHDPEGDNEPARPEAMSDIEPSSKASEAPRAVNPASPAATVERDPALLSQELLEIVSDKTGYPAEMLELDMDMEADLGIDSIKRVEILGALQERHPDLPEIETDALAELRSLAQVIDYVAGVEVTSKKA